MINAINQEIILNDTRKMPGYGFGLYKSEGEELTNAISVAYECNYRLYDTAAFYKNEKTSGKALKKYPRSSFFLVSKIWPTDFSNPVKALDRSLEELEVEYIDAYLLHWPGTDEKAMLKTFETLSKEQEKGKILTLGVSNFLKPHLENIYKNFNKWVPINQIEIHPYYQETELCDYCSQHNIAIMAWSPIGRGDSLKDPVIGAIAMETGKTRAQVILRWHVQKNHIPLPKSVHAERIRENADVFSFSLSDEQMKRINSLDKGIDGRRGADPMSFAG